MTEKWKAERYLPNDDEHFFDASNPHISAFHSAMRNHDKFDPLADYFFVIAFEP